MRAYNVIAITAAGSVSKQTPPGKIGIEDRFGESGEPRELTKVFGLSVEYIARRAKEACGKKLSV